MVSTRSRGSTKTDLMAEPIIDSDFLLEKKEGKGGWTYITIPPIENLPKKRNGTVSIRGSIDDYEIKCHMWAMKNGNFIPVKAEIRKQIKKEEGDAVRVTIYLDEPEMVIPDDLLTCLKEEPALYKRFSAFPGQKKKEITDWIFSAKTEDMKIQRIGQTIERLENGELR
jgi:hypothetical protein